MPDEYFTDHFRVIGGDGIDSSKTKINKGAILGAKASKVLVGKRTQLEKVPKDWPSWRSRWEPELRPVEFFPIHLGIVVSLESTLDFAQWRNQFVIH